MQVGRLNAPGDIVPDTKRLRVANEIALQEAIHAATRERKAAQEVAKGQLAELAQGGQKDDAAFAAEIVEELVAETVRQALIAVVTVEEKGTAVLHVGPRQDAPKTGFQTLNAKSDESQSSPTRVSHGQTFEVVGLPDHADLVRKFGIQDREKKREVSAGVYLSEKEKKSMIQVFSEALLGNSSVLLYEQKFNDGPLDEEQNVRLHVVTQRRSKYSIKADLTLVSPFVGHQKVLERDQQALGVDFAALPRENFREGKQQWTLYNTPRVFFEERRGANEGAEQKDQKMRRGLPQGDGVGKTEIPEEMAWAKQRYAQWLDAMEMAMGQLVLSLEEIAAGDEDRWERRLLEDISAEDDDCTWDKRKLVENATHPRDFLQNAVENVQMAILGLITVAPSGLERLESIKQQIGEVFAKIDPDTFRKQGQEGPFEWLARSKNIPLEERSGAIAVEALDKRLKLALHVGGLYKGNPGLYNLLKKYQELLENTKRTSGALPEKISRCDEKTRETVINSCRRGAAVARSSYRTPAAGLQEQSLTTKPGSDLRRETLLAGDALNERFWDLAFEEDRSDVAWPFTVRRDFGFEFHSARVIEHKRRQIHEDPRGFPDWAALMWPPIRETSGGRSLPPQQSGPFQLEDASSVRAVQVWHEILNTPDETHVTEASRVRLPQFQVKFRVIGRVAAGDAAARAVKAWNGVLPDVVNDPTCRQTFPDERARTRFLTLSTQTTNKRAARNWFNQRLHD